MKHRQLSLLFFLVMFVIGTDTFLVSPLLPTLTHYYGITTSLSGFIVSAYAIGYMLSALLIGPISDRHDRKKILVGGLVVFTVATASCGLANTFAWMLITRFVAGIAAATAGPQIWAAIPVLFPRQQVVKVMGYATAGLAVAQIVGVPLGSYLAVWSWRFPFFFVGAIALILTLLVMRLMPSLNDAKAAPASESIYRQLVGNHPVMKLLAAYLLFQTANFCGFAFIGTWFAKSFNLSVGAIGSFILLIGVGQFVGSLLGSRLVTWLGQPHAFLLEFILFIIGYVVLPFANSPLAATIILALIYTIGGALLQEHAGTARSTISALANAVMYLGEAIGGVIGGVLIKQFAGFSGIATFTAVVAVLAMLLYAQQGYFKQLQTSR